MKCLQYVNQMAIILGSWVFSFYTECENWCCACLCALFIGDLAFVGTQQFNCFISSCGTNRWSTYKIYGISLDALAVAL